MKSKLKPKFGAAALGAAALSLCGPAYSAEPAMILHKDKWIANFDKDSCQLITSFGTGEGAVRFRMTRFKPGDDMSVDMVGKYFDQTGRNGKILIAFGPDNNMQEKPTLNSTFQNLPAILIRHVDLLNRKPLADNSDPAPITEQQEAAIKWVDVALPGREPIRLEFGSLANPMRVMRACMKDLVESWGYTVDDLAKIAQPPVPLKQPGTWISTSDYPKGMIAKAGGGPTEFRLDVTSQGETTGCNVLQRATPDEFADFTCQLLLKRARFKPATDREKQPVKSYYMGLIWLRPG